MDEKTPNLITSGYSKHITDDGVTIELCIYRLEYSSEWSLEVVNSNGTSIVWDSVFSSDDAAYMEFKRILKEEGISSFLDNDNVIQFPR